MMRFEVRGRRTATALAVAVVAALATGCGTTSSGDGDGGDGGDGPIKLGYTATLSGEFASYGLEMRDGVELAVAEINADGGIEGRTIEIESQDDQGKPSNGPVVAQKMCDDDAISAVLGYSFSSVALAAGPVYTQCQLPIVASAVTSPELSGSSPYFFRNVLSDSLQGRQMGEYSVEQLGHQRIAVLFQQDDYGVGTSNGFVEGVEASGGTITSKEAYQLGTNDFASQIAGIKSDAPDAIYIGGFYTEAAKIAKQARRAGLDLPLLGTDGSLSPDLIRLGGDAVEGMTLYGVFTPTLDEPDVQRFVKAYEDKTGEAPTSWAALAYDAVYSVKAAMEAAGGTGRADVAEALPGLTYDGVTGSATFNEQGDREGSIVFLRVEDGEFVEAPEQ